MNLNLLKQRIILSALVTISLSTINPSYGQELEIDLYNLCSKFPCNSLCQKV